MRSRDDLVGAVVFATLAGASACEGYAGTPGAWCAAALLTAVALLSVRRVWLALGSPRGVAR